MRQEFVLTDESGGLHYLRQCVDDARNEGAKIDRLPIKFEAWFGLSGAGQKEN